MMISRYPIILAVAIMALMPSSTHGRLIGNKNNNANANAAATEEDASYYTNLLQALQQEEEGYEHYYKNTQRADVVEVDSSNSGDGDEPIPSWAILKDSDENTDSNNGELVLDDNTNVADISFDDFNKYYWKKFDERMHQQQVDDDESSSDTADEQGEEESKSVDANAMDDADANKSNIYHLEMAQTKLVHAENELVRNFITRVQRQLTAVEDEVQQVNNDINHLEAAQDELQKAEDEIVRNINIRQRQRRLTDETEEEEEEQHKTELTDIVLDSFY